VGVLINPWWQSCTRTKLQILLVIWFAHYFAAETAIYKVNRKKLPTCRQSVISKIRCGTNTSAHSDSNVLSASYRKTTCGTEHVEKDVEKRTFGRGTNVQLVNILLPISNVLPASC